MKRLLSFISFICLFTGTVFGLSPLKNGVCPFGRTDSVIYSKDLRLKDGFYLAFTDFKSNHPVPRSKIISNYDKNALDFLKQEIQKTEIRYFDSSNTERTIKTGKLWGYCSNNNIYINFGREFSKIMVVGSICHFTAFVEVMLGSYSPYVNSPTNMRSGYELQQFVLDHRSGKIGDFNVTNMEALLKQDDAIYTEFMALKKKKKRDLMFFYLRKFNEQHPVYFSQ